MSRQVVEVEDWTLLRELDVIQPVRLVFPNPRRGGPAVSVLRDVLAPKGRLRFSGTHLSLFADVDPGEPEPPRVALETIVRSDADGLERLLLSVLPHVDAVVLGVDGRSDDETLRVARVYADTTHVFTRDDLGLSEEDWGTNNKIDFAKARNLGRAQVKAPWTLVLDSDEYLALACDFRALAESANDEQGAFAVDVRIEDSAQPFVMKGDAQRFARTEYRWERGTHNQLVYRAQVSVAEGALIVSNRKLRDAAVQALRDAQRDRGVQDLIEAAAKGDLSALFHLVKHKATRGEDASDVARMAEEYRSKIEPHSPLADERAWLAMTVAFRFYSDGNLPEADRWAVRALLDGPRMAAFCVLGDVAEDQGDLERARDWYRCACGMESPGRLDWPGLTELRFGRLAGIELALLGRVRQQSGETSEPPAAQPRQE